MPKVLWRKWLATLDHRVARRIDRTAHRAHRIAIGVLFIWFGLLKPFGLKTTTSMLAETIYIGSPDIMVPVLGWWEVAIGFCLIVPHLVRVAVLLLLLRLPGIVLAFIISPEVCFVHFPLAPTPQGQYLLKDMVIFLATLAIAGRDATPVDQRFSGSVPHT